MLCIYMVACCRLPNSSKTIRIFRLVIFVIKIPTRH